MKIEPWTGQKGILAMPLLSNIPKGREGWVLMKCPICGKECWKRPLQDELVKHGMKVACTLCALKWGANNECHGTDHKR